MGGVERMGRGEGRSEGGAGREGCGWDGEGLDGGRGWGEVGGGRAYVYVLERFGGFVAHTASRLVPACLSACLPARPRCVDSCTFVPVVGCT